MVKLRVYIVQFMSILLLLCMYFIDAREDKAYDMHFNTDSSSSYVIKKATSHPFSKSHNVRAQAMSSTDKGTTKNSIEKNISYRVIIPQNIAATTPFAAADVVAHTSPIPDGYDYLFYREINPPPPKSC